MAEEDKAELGWRAMFYDAWFFPTLFFAIFGGSLPIIALIQTVIVVHDFAPPIQEVITAYHNGMAVFGAWAEPLLRPLLNWLGGLIGFKLHLYPHWRHLLVLAVILPAASFRARLNRADLRGWFRVCFVFLTSIPFAICGAVLAGLVNISGGLFDQILISIITLGWMATGSSWSRIVNDLVKGHLKEAFGGISEFANLFCCSGFVSSLSPLRPALERLFPQPFDILRHFNWIPSALHSLVPVAGLVFVGATIVGLGVSYIWMGSKEKDYYSIRLGLTVLGGFLGAGLVFAADWALKTFA